MDTFVSVLLVLISVSISPYDSLEDIPEELEEVLNMFFSLLIYSNTQNDFSLGSICVVWIGPYPIGFALKKASLGVTITSNVSDNDFGAQFVIKGSEINPYSGVNPNRGIRCFTTPSGSHVYTFLSQSTGNTGTLKMLIHYLTGRFENNLALSADAWSVY